MDTFCARIPQTEAHDQAAQILIAHGAVVDLAHAASLGDADTVRHLLEAEPELVNWKREIEPLITGSADFETPMQAAVRREREGVVAVLKEFRIE